MLLPDLLSETPQSPAADIIVLGKIVDAYGLRGAVKVHVFADDPAVWAAMPHWWLGGLADDAQEWQQVKVLGCREQSGLLFATLEGIADRNDAESLRGRLVGAPRQVFPATRKDEYYWTDLIGLEVVNTHDQSLGKVLGLIETAANDVLRVGDEMGNERLLPFVAAVVLDVDLPVRRVRVDWETDW